MNYLIRIENSGLSMTTVMVTSLLENNTNSNIFCVTSEIEENNKILLEDLVCKYESKIVFIDERSINNIMNNRLINESAHIMFCHLFLPKEVDRIIYISNDSIVNKNLQEIYELDFEDNYLAVRGQSMVYDNNYKPGARPEKGQHFDSRFMVINVAKLRGSNIEIKIEEALAYYTEINSVQGLLNCIYKDSVKYIREMEYNFRYSIYSEAERNKINITFEPSVISYEKRDYFFCGKNSFLPWNVNPDLQLEEEIKRIICDIPFELRNTYEINWKIFRLWHHYAKKTSSYDIMISQIDNDRIISEIKSNNELSNYCKIRKILEDIKKNIVIEYDLLKTIQYKYLVKYIDSLNKEDAITTMNNLFEINKFHMRDSLIKVGFVVYSSAEWQCELLYRKLELDERFDPVIIIVNQQLDDVELMNDIYINTKSFFEKKYKYLSLVENKEDIDEINMLVYCSPFEMSPKCANVTERKLCQLIVDVQYGYYIEDKDDIRYGDTYFDRPFYKILWKYFVSSTCDIQYTSERQRLEGFNIAFSGLPKMDEYIFGRFSIRKDIWKCAVESPLKIIWAPHFNMEKGMNGTFYMNYKWFLQYAREHKEVSWVVRPHPRFAMGAINAGIFKNNDEVYQYFDEWNKLPNAKVIQYGDYFDIFDTSDAMILDSLSFFVEYQFTGKKLLYLIPNEIRGLNLLGKTLFHNSKVINGADFDSIKNFIIDCKENINRQKVIPKVIDYILINKKSATEFIYEIINF